MKLLILSDSHGSYAAVVRAIKAAGEIDAVFFLGDGESEFFSAAHYFQKAAVCAVRGNCDYTSSLQQLGVIELGGHKILYAHGHTLGVKYDKSVILSAARENGCDCAFFGHTHTRFLEKTDGIWLFNPGSVSCPRDGKPPSCGIVTESGGELYFEFVEP